MTYRLLVLGEPALGLEGERVEADPSDAGAVAAVAAAATRAEGPVALLGTGERAAQALIAAALTSRLLAVVLVDPVLVRRRLDAAHPAQPLDLVAGLATPVQIHVAADAPGLLATHVEDLEARLVRRSVPFQILVYPGERSVAGAGEVTRQRAAHRARVFLAEIAARVAHRDEPAR
jgi:dienelactone hydrolase